MVSTTPKIHCDDPTVEDHSLFDEETGLRIPFTLNGIFSVFATRSLNEDEIENAENYKTIFLTPDSNSWDPYNVSNKGMSCRSGWNNHPTPVVKVGVFVLLVRVIIRIPRIGIRSEEDSLVVFGIFNLIFI